MCLLVSHIIFILIKKLTFISQTSHREFPSKILKGFGNSPKKRADMAPFLVFIVPTFIQSSYIANTFFKIILFN